MRLIMPVAEIRCRLRRSWSPLSSLVRYSFKTATTMARLGAERSSVHTLILIPHEAQRRPWTPASDPL